MGSSRTGPALAIASRKPSEPAILKLISERVDRVVLAVEAVDPHVDDRDSRSTPPLAMVSSMPFSHGRDELAGDGPAHDLVDELEAVAALEGLDAQDGHAELAVAAGLLLVLALGLGRGR